MRCEVKTFNKVVAVIYRHLWLLLGVGFAVTAFISGGIVTWLLGLFSFAVYSITEAIREEKKPMYTTVNIFRNAITEETE